MLAKRQTIPQQSPAYHLVERVVPSHVFTEQNVISGGTEQGAGMQAASAFEGFLRGGKRSGQFEQDLWLNLEIVLNRWKLLPNSLNRRFAADAATRRGENMASQLLQVQGFRLSQPHVDHIPLRPAHLWPGPRNSFTRDCFSRLLKDAATVARRPQAMRTVPDVNKIASCMHQALGHEKSCRQFAIFARRPHDDGDAVAFDPDFQRLLGSKEVLVVRTCGAVHPPQGNFSDSAAKQG